MNEVCIVCLNRGNQYEEVKNLLKDLLDALMISLDTTGSQKSIVCEECVAQIYELFNFKTLCLYTEDALFPFIEENDGKVAQLLDLRSVYSEIKLRQFSGEICRLCLEISTEWVSLEMATSQNDVRDVIEKNLPEISLQAIERPCICENCLKMLDKLHNFASQCKSSANKIHSENQVENQVRTLLANEVENQFENEFDNKCKIEIHEHPFDCVENDIKRFVQNIQTSDGCIKEENDDVSSGTKESDLGSTASQNTLETHRPIEDSKKPILCDSCPNVYFNHVDLALHSINHSENGMYSCHVCKNYSNVEKKYMKIHIRAHDGKEVEVQFDTRGNSSLIQEHCEENITSNETKKSRSWCRTLSCVVCGQSFDTEPVMMEHIENAHGRNICSHCGKKFSKRCNLNNHLRTHTGEKPYICSTCGKGFSQKSHLNSHLLRHTRVKPYICSICGNKFVLKGDLTIHLRTHAGEKPHICSHCRKGFTRKWDLKIHLRTHTEEKLYLCTTCGKGFSQKSHFNNHLLRHTGAMPYICSTCGKGFTQKWNLIIHMRSHTGEKPHVCSFCGKEFSQNVHLNLHLRTHTKEKPHICSTCGKGFSQISSLKNHLHTHKEDKPHVCTTCGRRFSLIGCFNNHLLRHMGEKPHICSFCGRGFSQNVHLNTHLLTHTKEKPHICSICGKAFSRRERLKQHLLIHSEEKSHICSHCGKGFTQKGGLNTHLRTHTGEKPHVCSICGKGFTKKQRLIFHSRTHTVENSQVC